jgi:hypothetical protein
MKGTNCLSTSKTGPVIANTQVRGDIAFDAFCHDASSFDAERSQLRMTLGPLRGLRAVFRQRPVVPISCGG